MANRDDKACWRYSSAMCGEPCLRCGHREFEHNIRISKERVAEFREGTETKVYPSPKQSGGLPSLSKLVAEQMMKMFALNQLPSALRLGAPPNQLPTEMQYFGTSMRLPASLTSYEFRWKSRVEEFLATHPQIPRAGITRLDYEEYPDGGWRVEASWVEHAATD